MALLQSIRTAMLRGFTDAEIITAESKPDRPISRRSLQRYKKAIRMRGLKTLPETTEEQRALFNVQVERWRDLIRQANRLLMGAAVSTGRISAAPLLRVINECTKNIAELSLKVGILPTAPVKVQADFKVLVEMWDDENKADGVKDKNESDNPAS